MSFVDLVNTMMGPKKEASLTKKLEHYILNYPDDYAKDDVFHPSQLYYMCPRQEVLKRILPVELVPPETKEMMTYAKFHIGHAMHSWYQNKYLGPMGVLIGSWQCLRCGVVVDGLYPTDIVSECAHGGKHLWEYVEPPVYSAEWNIRGKCDGIIMQNNARCVIDMKTSSPDWFKKMTRPWPSAKYQVEIYMWLLGIQQGLLLYIDKSADGKEPVREFPLKYNTNTINDVQGKITSFRVSMEDRFLAPCLCGKSKFGMSCAEIEDNADVLSLVKAWEKSEKEI